MRALLVEFEPYGPWDVEAAALAAVGGRLDVVSAEELATDPRDCELLLNAYAAPAPAAVLDAMPSLRCAVSYGVGVDWIDLADATGREIVVANMPLANVEDVATHAFALLLGCVRRLSELDANVRSGTFDWPRSKPLHRLRGRRLGLVAFGSIARIVAEFARPFGLQVVAHDPYVEAEEMRRLGVEPVSLEELFAASEIVSVHVPSTLQTRGLVGEQLFGLLPEGAIVIVTSRGDIYDLDALLAALARGQVAAAGLDVFPDEPLPYGHPVAALPNVILSPHVAGYSEESIDDLHRTGAAIIAAFGRGGRVPGAVNVVGRRAGRTRRIG